MMISRIVKIHAAENLDLEGDLCIPAKAVGIVLFAHGSGSSRKSRRNKYVAKELNEAGLATLLFDLRSEKEETVDAVGRKFRFDIRRLARRLVAAVDFLKQSKETSHLKIGLFGSSTGGGAALVAAVQRPKCIHALISRGGRLDLASEILTHVETPTLLIIGANDPAVIHLNENAYEKLKCEKKMEIIAGAGHLFEESGALEQVAGLTRSWFQDKLK